jgi:hypothetical protein
MAWSNPAYAIRFGDAYNFSIDIHGLASRLEARYLCQELRRGNMQNVVQWQSAAGPYFDIGQ